MEFKVEKYCKKDNEFFVKLEGEKGYHKLINGRVLAGQRKEGEYEVYTYEVDSALTEINAEELEELEENYELINPPLTADYDQLSVAQVYSGEKIDSIYDMDSAVNYAKEEQKKLISNPPDEYLRSLKDAAKRLYENSYNQDVEKRNKDFDLVKEVRMENGETMLFTYSAEQKALTFTIPRGAVNGPIYVVPASGVLVQVAEIKMATPEDVKAQETEITAGKELTLTGKNMDMIAAVLFPGVEKAVEPTSLSETEVKVVVPGEAQSGMIQLVLTSGETISGLELTVTAPKYCHIADENILKTNDYFVGEDMVVDVVNIGELAVVQVAGTKVNYTSSGSQLTIPVPETAGHDSSVELISKDGTCKKYTVSFTKVIWEGSYDIGDWDGNQALGWDGYDWSSVQPGTIITVYYTLNTGTTNWQIRLGGCAIGWGELPNIPSASLEAGSTKFSAALTEEDLEVLSRRNPDDNNKMYGLVVTGCNFTMTKVTLK